MSKVCPKCGTQNRDTAKYCSSCRALLEQPAPAPTLPPAPAPDATGKGGNGPIPVPAAVGGTVPLASAAPEPAVSPPAAVPPAAVPPVAEPAALNSVDAPTVHLAAPTFASLPEGALLNNRRYEVIAVLNSGPKLNVYQVVDRQQRYCPQCGSTGNARDDEYCAACGVALPKSDTTFWLRETWEARMWEGEQLMAAEKIWHPGLINIYQVFQDRPYGDRDRWYMVSDPEEGQALSALPRQPEEKVLDWAQQLAAALGYLHSKGFRHRNLRAASVRLVGDRARLTYFAKTDKPRPIEDRDWPVAEVADLTTLLRDELLAGQPVSPATTAILNRAFSPDKKNRYATTEALAADLANAAEALQRAESLTLVAGRRSHVGMVRDHNEDSLMTLELQRVQLSESQPAGVYVVADGMGGHEAGEVASGIAINTVATVLTQKLLQPTLAGNPPPTPGDLLKEAFQEANRAVNERGRKARTDMGTTLVGALVIGNQAYIANIGDSRCYRLSGGELKQVTADHSLVARLVAANQITPEEARVHPQRNYIYRTVGDKPQVEVDLFQVRLKPDDCLLLCSDGLSGMVDDPLIQATLLSQRPPQAVCESLIQLANSAGGDDNISVIVVQVAAANDHRK